MNERNTTLAWLIAGCGMALALRKLQHKQRAYDFTDKVVLITGGGRGLGLVLARQLAEMGARLALCARDADELQRAEQDLTARGARHVFTVTCDVTQPAQVAEMAARVRARYGAIDALINNAGVIQVGALENQTVEDFAQAMDVHFWGALHTTLAVLPEMRARRAGRIINIASIGGKIAVPHLAPYSASKFALVGLSAALRAELTPDNIYVTTVCPGLMRTGSHVNATFKGQHRAEFAWFSIGDSQPGISISAERAARQIIAASQRGAAELIITLPAQIAVKAQTLMPELVADALGLVHRLLPAPDLENGARRLPGKNSQSALAPSLLTTLADRAALANNELNDAGGSAYRAALGEA